MFFYLPPSISAKIPLVPIVAKIIEERLNIYIYLHILLYILVYINNVQYALEPIYTQEIIKKQTNSLNYTKQLFFKFDFALFYLRPHAAEQASMLHADLTEV